MKQKRVVVTGGAGFIGSHLAEELSRQGYYVVILDNLSTGKKENIKLLLKQENVEFHQGSVTDCPLLQKLFRDVDYVFHLAAIPSVTRSIEDPLASYETNVTGTLNVLLAARDNGVKKLIYASSSSVYGDTPTLPKREDMLPNPQSPYAVTKLASEYYCRVFHQVYELPTICLRYFNVYGPRQDPNSQYAAVIPRFIDTISRGSPPVIFGDGEQTRDFTFVKDVVAANILAAESELTGIFNIGNGESISVNQLTGLIIKLMGSTLEPIHEAPRLGDIKHSLADISRARAFGFEPKFSLEAGIRETKESLKREA
ncbi:MAG: SDR family oxidoreductase [Chloroflexota bacterium]